MESSTAKPRRNDEPVTQAEVRIFLTDYINRKLGAAGRDSYEDLPDDCDLWLSGMIDSMGVLELMGVLEEFSGRDIDFEVLDPEEMTVVGPLCRFVSQQTLTASSRASSNIDEKSGTALLFGAFTWATQWFTS
jgi:acyl carrier protein